ncbi:MAG: type II secretion system protein [Planctomycetota bacterium]
MERNLRYKGKENSCGAGRRGFTLVEVVTAVIILALICGSVVVVINREFAVAGDNKLRIEAFELARENMEKQLASTAVEEMIESGESETNPDIRWENVVEAFFEANTQRMWIRAICSATYVDYRGEEKTVELTHWLTDVSKEMMLAIMAEKQARLDEEQKAMAQYMFVAKDSSGKGWALYTVADDQVIKLETYDSEEEAVAQGQDRAEEADMDFEEGTDRLAEILGGEEAAAEALESPLGPEDYEKIKEKEAEAERVEIIPGYTEEELNKLSFDEIWRLLMQSDR